MKWYSILFFCLLSGWYTPVVGQGNSGRAILTHFTYGAQSPMGDLADRFGQNFAAGLAVEYMTNNNWAFGVESQLLFGNNVKEDVLAGLRTSAGLLIGNDRSPAEIQLRQRGSYYGLTVGKLIGLAPNNPRSGLRITLGIGLLSHRIRIQEDPTRDVPQVGVDYEKGYDRLTNGLALHQFIGYQVLSKNNGIHVIAGFELTEGFTQSRRNFDFDRMAADTQQRFDMLVGFRLGFTLPFYLGDAEDVFY